MTRVAILGLKLPTFSLASCRLKSGKELYKEGEVVLVVVKCNQQFTES